MKLNKNKMIIVLVLLIIMGFIGLKALGLQYAGPNAKSEILIKE